ncbi:MAG TPA: ethylbenzene dehydrogenase-related protein [Bradyrhizobium sp.]|nr:ethylbenzene dehydrogenase-related protein [Bradyrhizobium sp.]
MKHPRTDYGTIILHWLFVAAFGVAFSSGMRIATEAPGRLWINLFDGVLPRESVWNSHMQAAVALVAVSLAYAVYLLRSGLARRVQFDQVRLRGLFGRGQARLRAINVVLYWFFFVTMAVLLASGGLLYFGVLAGSDVVTLHWYATWAIFLFAGLHVLTHVRLGGIAQLLRVFRPTQLSPPPAPLDAVELLTLLAEQSARLAPDSGEHDDRTEPHRQAREDAGRNPVAHAATGSAATFRTKSRSPTLQANPLVVAAAVAIAGTSIMVAADRMSLDHLQIHRIDSADAPVLDGDTSDRAWRNIHPFSLMTNQGGNFDDKGETRIEIRAVHDGTWAYFLFAWEDPTRSLKHLPLVKEIDGWHLLHNGYEKGDEHEYHEDKFSALFTTAASVLAGDRTFHASPHPIPGGPTTSTGRGLHFTSGDIGYVDVWQWKATSGGPTGWIDDSHFGPPLEPTPMQASNAVPYRGGYAPDPGTANYTINFTDVADRKALITPRRLPKDFSAVTAALGQIDLDPDHGESEGARWFMLEAESEPYTTEQDRRIPVGTVIPGVIIGGEFSGDRADVRCAARWASGHWALEVARRLDTGSPYDVPIASGTFMRVAAFDHSQIRHTRHVRPIRLEVE